MFGRGFKQSAFLGQGFGFGTDPLETIIPGGTDLQSQVQADTPRCYQCPETPEPRMLVPDAATVCQEVNPSLCAEGATPAADLPADVVPEDEPVGGVPCPSCVCKIPGTEDRPCFDFNWQGTGKCGVKTMDTSNCIAQDCVEAIDPATGETFWAHPGCPEVAPPPPPDQLPVEDLCPDGQPRNPDGTCESAYHADVCPDGSPMPADGVCPPEETCPEGQEMILGQCGTAAIACPNGDGTYRVFEIEEWNGRTGNNVPTGRVFAEAATQDQLREFRYDRIVYLTAEESECSGGASDEHFGCLRVINGLYDIINPDTGEVLESGIEEANLPPNTIRLLDAGTECNPCPAGMTAHEGGYGCCEPSEIVTNENGECVERRVCHHPGINNDYAETLPDNMDWWDSVGGYTPPGVELLDTPVDAAQCGVTPEPTACPEGQEYDASGVCVPIQVVCQEGEELDAAGVCQPIEVVCSEGEKLDAAGVCQPIEVVCPEGEEAQADGTCALIPCVAGEIRNDAGECAPASETEYQWCGDDEIGYTLFKVVNGEVTDIIAEDVPTPDTRAYLDAPITVPIGGDLCGAPTVECPAGEVLYDDGTCGFPEPEVTPEPGIPVDGGVPLPGGGGGAGPVPVGGGGSLPGGGGFPGGTPAGGIPTGGGVPTGGTPAGGVPTSQGTGIPTQQPGGAPQLPAANPFPARFVPCGSKPPVNIRKLRTETVAARPDAFTEAWTRY